MSKRKAEDILSCCPATKRFISLLADCKSVNPLLGRKRTGKRKVQAAELDLGRLQADRKRAEGARQGPNPGDRSASDGARVQGGREEEGARAPREPRTSPNLAGSAPRAALPPNTPWDEASCQYNSFQFWRVPLPKLELAEIEDVNHMKIPEEMNCDILEEAAEMEIELQN
ncbi:uncharacterized protein C9orf40 homolog [Narcine bancroftii]|uniref:uncharacterized protein C9orf40 homolog n=1 Tax=Narcine bancroftii TaxID=1343680 RepID=UPI003831F0A4